MMASTRIGFIGAGMMATSMIKGFLAAKVASAQNICGTDVMEVGLERLRGLGVGSVKSNVQVVNQSDVVFLAIKPYAVPGVLDEICSTVTTDKLIVSIAAGVTIASIQSRLPAGSRVIRVMPNTPCCVRQSASGFVAGDCATETDMKLVGELLNSIGVGLPCKESDLNAVTGLSGSGPAYVFIMIEALADGGVRCGLARDVALKLAAQTVKGAAQMVLETEKHPGVLKDQVCSPGGTTIAAVEALERGAFRATVMSAVTSAKEKADEMSTQSKV